MNNVPAKYGGAQNLVIQFQDGDTTVPLVYRGALMYIPMRKPTRQELNDGNIYDLTSSQVWKPREEETDEDMIAPADDEEMHVQCKAITNSMRPDYAKL